MTLKYLMTSGRAAILVTGLALSMSAAYAQTTDRPAAAAAAQTSKNNWAVNCGTGETAEAPLLCQMMQNVVVQETNQRLLTVVVRPQKDSANHTLTLALPHGVDFIKGVEVQVDEKEAFNVPVQTSNGQGAFSNLPISDELLADLKAGTSVKFTFHAVSGQTFAVPISLIGFSTAYDKLSAG
ncbi:Invasion protein B, involved in pathogenesis [Hoeflea sp. IMCC20628]|uniref:invasion associated locus B family protein n=1 Tax=Hoeflea sp. IMCC20628 TaxID=1620421 RepID=UPI00063BED2D|nr:invasion associated locus B family protein [Hoeflea sp. IMCC20628]AKI02025.1 Invasion protein B, involved in pathogenesis [Hoeflea sp. IMCC20628]